MKGPRKGMDWDVKPCRKPSAIRWLPPFKRSGLARAEGLGVGWVSILDPDEVKLILDLPSHWSFIAYLCLGWPEVEDDVPELERHGWEQRQCEASAAPLRR